MFLLATGRSVFAAADHPLEEFNQKRYKLFNSYAAAMGKESDKVPGYSEAARLERNMRKYENKLEEYFEAERKSFKWLDPSQIVSEAVSGDPRAVSDFLKHNLSDTGMPLSFQADKRYWRKAGPDDGSVESVMERVLVGHGLNIYDGALWQIALTLKPADGTADQVDAHTRRLLEGESGDIKDIRAWGPAFRYGDSEEILSRESAFFFRMIADEYLQDDPLGYDEVAGFPNFDRVHHEDWKPIAGEQAWAVIIGPLQVAYRKHAGTLPKDCDELELAKSILPALKAMQSPIGGFYHAPSGTFGIHSGLISVENNLSIYAALRMLHQVLATQDAETAGMIEQMMKSQEIFFRKYAYDAGNHLFYSSGYYLEDRWVPGKLFATDCQTWAIAALGPSWIDSRFGEGESIKIWKSLLDKSGVKKNTGDWVGVGFTEGKCVVSVEWTCGAILAGRTLVKAYSTAHPDWIGEIDAACNQMRSGIDLFRVKIESGQEAYLYSSARYFVPFGWWANAIPSTASSAWVVLIDSQFNPFYLGGEPQAVL